MDKNLQAARRLIWMMKYGTSDTDLRRIAQILNYTDGKTLQKDIDAVWELIRAEQQEAEAD